jgi:hypothetical protein
MATAFHPVQIAIMILMAFLWLNASVFGLRIQWIFIRERADGTLSSLLALNFWPRVLANNSSGLNDDQAVEFHHLRRVMLLNMGAALALIVLLFITGRFFDA